MIVVLNFRLLPFIIYKTSSMCINKITAECGFLLKSNYISVVQSGQQNITFTRFEVFKSYGIRYAIKFWATIDVLYLPQLIMGTLVKP